MKIGRLKFQSKAAVKLFSVALVCLFILGVSSNKMSAQTFSELDPSIIENLEQLFQQESQKLRDEVVDPQPGVSIESNRNLHGYYQEVWREFQNDNVDLRTSFVSNLYILFRGNVSQQPLIPVLFEDAPSDSAGDKGNKPSNYQGNLVFLTSPAPLTPQFELILENLEIVGGDLSYVYTFFEFINSNK